MTHPLSSEIESLRQDSRQVLEALQEDRPSCELPPPPETLQLFQQKLEDDNYRVLVVGEAKRGKSSFINALIGRPILPTDVDIATSQVFLVSKAGQEGYRLRFEDESTREIAPEELPAYGSQVLADQDGAPSLDRIIRWIEVDAPVRFLPDGVSILDTPGLGSLYAAHSQITQRFIPHADAVIYVLSSLEPIVQQDLDTIEAILRATSNLFFIQTWIDKVPEKWEELRSRNEQILRERFADQLGDTRVWPISSTNLMKAAETGNAAYEHVSRHRELATALKVFLFRVAGLSRVAASMLVAGQYHDTTRQVLLGRVSDLMAQSKEERLAAQQQMAERKRQFDSDWGERGAKRQALMKSLQQVVTAGKQGLRQALESGGQIDLIWKDRIDQLHTLEEAQRLAPTMADQIVAAAVEKWQSLDGQVRHYVMEQLAPFLAAMDQLAHVAYSDTETPSHESYQIKTRDDWFEKAKGLRLNMMNASIIVGAGGSLGIGVAVGTGLASTAIFPPLAIGIAIAAGIWVLFQGREGWMKVKEDQLRKAQQELFRHLADIRDRVRRYYFDVNLEAGQFQNLVDAHFDQLAQEVGERLQHLASTRSEETQRELKRLKEQIALDEQQRTARLAELRTCLSDWEQVGAQLQAVIARMTQLDETLSRFGQPTTEAQPA